MTPPESLFPGGDPRRFAWDITLDSADYKAVTAAYARRRRRSRKPVGRAFYVVAWLALVAAIVVFMRVGTVELPPAFIGFVAGAFAAWLALWLHYRLIVMPSIGRLNGLEGKIINTVVDAAGVRSNTDTTSTAFVWAGIEVVDETDTHHFLWPAAAVVLILPKRVFRDVQEGRQFAAALKDWTIGTENDRRRPLAEAASRR